MTVAETLRLIEDGEIYYHPRCKACHIPDELPYASLVRRRMAQLFVEGFPERQIEKVITPFMRSWDSAHAISWSNLKNHLHHMPDEFIMERGEWAKIAKVVGKDFTDYHATEAAIPGRAVIQSMLREGIELMHNGRLKITAGDLIRLAMIEHSMSTEEDTQGELMRLRAQSETLIQIVSQVVPPELQAEIASRVGAVMRQGELQAAPTLALVPGLEDESEPDYAPRRGHGRTVTSDEEED